jgi:hypothetical protein
VTVTPDGGFLVVYTIPFPPMSFWRVLGRRFDAAGAPLGGEFQISSFPDINVFSPVAARDAGGNFVVAWNGYGQDGSQSSVVARRLDAAGNPRGAEFLVNTYTTGTQDGPAVAVRDDGSFVIAWGGLADAGGLDAAGVFARRFEADGTPVGAEFQVNTFTTSTQNNPSVAIDDGGRVLISWTSYLQDGDEGGIYARRYDAAGAPLGPEFGVNSYTSGRQWRSAAAASPSGNLVVAWESSSQDGSSYGIYGQRMGGLVPEALFVDAPGNGVLEPA